MKSSAFSRPFAGRLRATVLLGAVVATAAGCGGPAGASPPPRLPGCAAAETRSLALVLGARANSPAPELPSSVQALLDAAMDAEATVTVVRVDGAPEKVFGQAFHTEAQNGPARNADHDAYVTQVQAAMRATKAIRPEADPLTAVAVAARAVGEGGTVVVVDSGLQTIPPLDFRRGDVLDAEPADVAGFLARKSSLPRLARVHVLLAGIGDTAAPQAALPVRQHDNLVAMWQAIAEKAGAACVSVDTTPRRSKSVEGTPAVSRVAVPPAQTYTAGCGTHVLRNSGSVGFKPDRAVLRDPAAAKVALQDLADWALAHHAKVRLTGTTASAGTEAGRRRLSLQRAEAVRAVLVDLGVPADRITVRGVGTDWPGHVNDLADGILLPGPAERNRSVVVTPGC